MVPPGFAAELRRAAAASGVVPRLVAEQPEEWRLGRLTVVIDHGRGTAQVRYARNAVARSPSAPGELVASCDRALAKLAAGSLEPERFGPAAAAAYAAMLARAGQLPGHRVDIVDLWPEIARAAGRDRYSRAQLAWDLARLRAERGLVLPEGRIVLDVATGRAAASRRIWVEDASGAGQYYRSFRLVPP